MASSVIEPELVTESVRCAEIVKDLDNESDIAMAAKCVNLGPRGPLTLVVIGTRDGRLYLFDVHTNKTLLGDGYLKDVLESTWIMKIVHQCGRVCAALRSQFNVVLTYVFDAQVADLELQKSEGRRFPVTLKFAEICDKYGGASTTLSSEDKIIKNAEMDSEAYWAIRPITQKMIGYAISGIRVEFVVCDNQLRLLQDRKLYAKFQASVEETTGFRTDKAVRDSIKQRALETINTVLTELDEKCKRGVYTCLKDLDDDEKFAMSWTLNFTTYRRSPVFIRIRQESLAQLVEDAEREIESSDDMDSRDIRTLFNIKLYTKLYNNIDSYAGTDFGQKIRKLFDNITKAKISQMTRKYKTSTPLEFISDTDILFMSYFDIATLEDELLVELFNRGFLYTLQNLKKRYDEGQTRVSIYDHVYNNIRVLATQRTPCSPELVLLSQQLWETFVERFGRVAKRVK